MPTIHVYKKRQQFKKKKATSNLRQQFNRKNEIWVEVNSLEVENMLLKK